MEDRNQAHNGILTESKNCRPYLLSAYFEGTILENSAHLETPNPSQILYALLYISNWDISLLLVVQLTSKERFTLDIDSENV